MEAGEPKVGKCNSCGFLAKLQKYQSAPPPYIYEMPFKERQNGALVTWTINGRQVECIATCYEDVDIRLEIFTLEENDEKGECEALRKVFEKDRRCFKWRKYVHGLSPQEHWMKMNAEELELKRQEIELRMANDHKEFMRVLDSGNKRVQFILGFVLGGIAVLEIIVGVLQVLYPAGFPWLQSIFGIIPPPPTVSPIPGM